MKSLLLAPTLLIGSFMTLLAPVQATPVNQMSKSELIQTAAVLNACTSFYSEMGMTTSAELSDDMAFSFARAGGLSMDDQMIVNIDIYEKLSAAGSLAKMAGSCNNVIDSIMNEG